MLTEEIVEGEANAVLMDVSMLVSGQLILGLTFSLFAKLYFGFDTNCTFNCIFHYLNSTMEHIIHLSIYICTYTIFM